MQTAFDFFIRPFNTFPRVVTLNRRSVVGVALRIPQLGTSRGFATEKQIALRIAATSNLKKVGEEIVFSTRGHIPCFNMFM